MSAVTDHNHNGLYERKEECRLHRENFDIKIQNLIDQMQRGFKRANWLNVMIGVPVLLALIGNLIAMFFGK